jgi:hypothetical protein
MLLPAEAAIEERVRRFRVMEATGRITPKIVGLWEKWLDNEEYSAVFRNVVSLQIMAYAIGRPSQQMLIDSMNTDVAYTKIVHEVRWLPPDPKDTSVEVKPEPD